MEQLKIKIDRVNQSIASPSTPKELIPGLKKKRDDLESQLDAEVARMEKEAADAEAKRIADIEAEEAHVKAEIAKKEAEAAAKKAKMRKQIVKKGGVTKVKMVKKKAKQVKRGKSIKSAHIPKAVLRGKKKANMVKLPKYVKSFNSGRGKVDIKRDSQRQAMAPGKHRQKRGSKHKFYYERRANRTDVSPKWKLAEGGPIGNKKYKITFEATQKGALGTKSKYSKDVYADSVDNAIIKLYDHYDHVRVISVNGEKYNYMEDGGYIYAKGGSFEKCPVGTKVQTLIFDNKEFTESSAKSWAEKNGMKYGKVDIKPDSYRLRQEPPFKFKKDSFRTIELGHSGVKAVVGCPRNAK